MTPHIFIIFILLAITSVIVDFSSSTLVLFSLFVGLSISFLFGRLRKDGTLHSIYYVKIFCLFFEVGWGYMLLCYWYMTSHDFDWILAYDTYNVFIPQTESYINQGHGNLAAIYRAIFSEYDFFSRDEYFYWVYSCTWGVLINKIGANMYFGLQLSTLFVYGFCGVFLFKLFFSYNFPIKKSYSHTILVGLFSILLFYSSQILRDIHVLLCFLIAFYLSSQQKYSFKTLIILTLVVYLTCGLRIESGLFLVTSIPIYLLCTMQQPGNKSLLVFLATILIIALLLFVIYENYITFRFVYDENYRYYTEGAASGTGITAQFQRIPILGDFLCILFNASNPIPVWIRLDPTRDNEFLGHTYNILNIVRIPAVIFNIITYVYIFFWFFIRKKYPKIKENFPRSLKYQLINGVFFLFLQSSVIAQRRLMGYYCIFYIFMFAIYDNILRSDKKLVNALVFATFVLIQIIGFLYVK